MRQVSLRVLYLSTLVASCMLLPSLCRADLTIQMHMAFDMPGMQSAMPQMQSSAQPILDKMADSTIYVSGHKVRTESSLFVMIADSDAGTMVMLSPSSKTYTSFPFSPDMMKKALSQSTSAYGTPGITENVIDTGRSTTILGHNAHHYIVRIAMTVMGHKMHMVQDILAATDISNPEASMYAGLAASYGGKTIPGFPLVTSTSYTGDFPYLTGMHMKQSVTSISTDPVSPDLFTVPSDYTQSTSSSPFNPAAH